VVQMLRWVGVLLLSMMLSVAVAEEETEAEKKDYSYIKLSPAFVLNIKRGTGPRFLQVKAEALVGSREDGEAVKNHMAAIRHTMIMTLSNQDGKTIRSTETREQLRTQAEEAVKQVLTEMNGKPTIEGLFFTNYVVQ
jgi:flagellar FliL protein